MKGHTIIFNSLYRGYNIKWEDDKDYFEIDLDGLKINNRILSECKKLIDSYIDKKRLFEEIKNGFNSRVNPSIEEEVYYNNTRLLLSFFKKDISYSEVYNFFEILRNEKYMSNLFQINI